MYDGKTVVITGAGAGIGRALALKLAKGGAQVWALDVNSESLAALRDEAGKFGHALVTREVDVKSREQVKAVRDEIVGERKMLDYWINNAGVAGLGEFQAMSPEEFDRIVAINLGAVIDSTRIALETMESQGHGRIVNMASIAGHLPAPYMTAYVATKHGVVGFTRALAEELRLKGSPVTLLLVSPGFVDTQIIAKGERLGFPEWLAFMLSTPDAVAQDIYRAMRTKKAEIFPTLNGKLMRKMYSLLPQTTVRSSKILLTKSLKDVVLNRYTR